MPEEYSKYDDIELYKTLSKSKKEAEAAFAELYSRYSQRIYAYCLRVTGNKEDANDIFQDTFFKFYDSAQEDTKVTSIVGYLVTIARNLCLNHKRSKRTKIDLENYNLKSNDTGYEEKELLDLIANAIEVLEDDYKETFILRQYQGLSYKEISQITGDSVSALKNRFWRAKEKIKDILSPYLEEISNTNS